jgi:hypothetical protein
MKLLPDRKERSKTVEKKKKEMINKLEYGDDLSSKISSKLSVNNFKGFKLPKRKKKKNGKTRKEREKQRQKILDQINQAIQCKSDLGRALVTGQSNSQWMKRKIERIENLMNLEKNIREQKLEDLKKKSFVKRFLEAKIDPK